MPDQDWEPQTVLSKPDLDDITAWARTQRPGGNRSGQLVVESVSSTILPKEITSTILASPTDILTVWERVNPSASPYPADVPQATLRIKIFRAKAWIEGKVVNHVHNNGDELFRNLENKGVKWLAQKDNSVLLQGAGERLDDLRQDYTMIWEIPFRVEGGVRLLKALFTIFTVGTVGVHYSAVVDAAYTQAGKLLGIFNTSRSRSYNRSFNVDAQVPVRNFNIKITAF